MPPDQAVPNGHIACSGATLAVADQVSLCWPRSVPGFVAPAPANCFAAHLIAVGGRNLRHKHLSAAALQRLRYPVKVLKTKRAAKPQHAVHQHDGITRLRISICRPCQAEAEHKSEADKLDELGKTSAAVHGVSPVTRPIWGHAAHYRCAFAVPGVLRAPGEKWCSKGCE